MNFVKAISTGKPTQYESVEDTKDLRIPVQNEEAFEHGISFRCKYIGTEEIPRPNSRVEIVAAMRRIRYEHKYRNIKKRKVFLDISADGIKVLLRKKKKNNLTIEDSALFIMHYAINRVFYVSHDSQDLKILSYIARGEDGVFRCSVFKALKKSQAMHVVRTIGQAFEVCHKINIERDKNKIGEASENKEKVEDLDEKSPNETDIDEIEDSVSDIHPKHIETVELQRPLSSLVTDLDAAREMSHLPPPLLPQGSTNLPLLINGDMGSSKHGAFTLQQLQQVYNHQLLQQMLEAETVKNELSRLRLQLKAEEDSRIQSQNQVHKLLAQNRELIMVIQKLMSKLQEKHCVDNETPIDNSWMLSNNTFNLSSSVNGFSMGSAQDFSSEIFDNTNVGPSPLHNFSSSKLVSSPGAITSDLFLNANFPSKSTRSNPFNPNTGEDDFEIVPAHSFNSKAETVNTDTIITSGS